MLILAFAIMSHKTELAYVAMLEKLCEAYVKINPDLVISPDYIMIDCEIALKNASVHVWPGTRTIMCFFHLMQAVKF